MLRLDQYRVVLPQGVVPSFGKNCAVCGRAAPGSSIALRGKTVDSEAEEELTAESMLLTLAGGSQLKTMAAWGVSLTGADADLEVQVPVCSRCQTFKAFHPLFRWGVVCILTGLFVFWFFSYMISLNGVTSGRLVVLALIAAGGTIATWLFYALTPPPLTLTGTPNEVTYGFSNEEAARDLAQRNHVLAPTAVRLTFQTLCLARAKLELSQDYRWGYGEAGLTWPLEAAGKLLVLDRFQLAMSPPPEAKVALEPATTTRCGPFCVAWVFAEDEEYSAVINLWPNQNRLIPPAFEQLLSQLGQLQALTTSVWEQQGGEAMDAICGKEYHAAVCLEGLAVGVQGQVKNLAAVQKLQSLARSLHLLTDSEHEVARVKYQ